MRHPIYHGTTGFPKPWIVTYRAACCVLIASHAEHLDSFGSGVPSVGLEDVNLHVHVLQWASGASDDDAIRAAARRTSILDDQQQFDPI